MRYGYAKRLQLRFSVMRGFRTIEGRSWPELCVVFHGSTLARASLTGKVRAQTFGSSHALGNNDRNLLREFWYVRTAAFPR